MAKSKGFALLYEMGAGKTLTALAIMGQLYKLGKIRTALIVAPTSVCSVWVDEIAKFAAYKAHAIHITGDKKRRVEAISEMTTRDTESLKVLIINYESVHRMGIYEALQRYAPDMIIADESQRIKTHNAKQSKAMHALGGTAKYKLILTGTPVQNNAVDFWSQYRFLDPTILGSNFYAFKNRYCRMGGYGNHQIIGYRNLPELTSKVHSIALRVTKDECLDLPEKTYMYTRLEMSPKERAQYDKLRIQSVTELEDSGEEVTAHTILTKILRLQQLTGGYIKPDESERYEQVSTLKLDALRDILEDYVIGTGKKLVIFARFRPELEGIAETGEARACATCPFNQFGSKGQGKACRNGIRLYLLRSGEILPLVLSVPPTSIRNLSNYVAKRLVAKGKRLDAVITKVALKKDKSAGGITYSKMTFVRMGDLSPEDHASVQKIGEMAKSLAHTVAISGAFEEVADDGMRFED